MSAQKADEVGKKSRDGVPVRVQVVLRGLNPGMVMNPAGDEVLQQLYKGSGQRKPTKRDISMEDLAASRVIRDEEGRICIPADYFHACFVEAGRQVKLDNQRKISTGESSVFGGLVQFEEEMIPLEVDTTEATGGRGWNLLAKKGRLPKDGTAVCIVRPRIPRWKATFHIVINRLYVSEEKIRETIERGGHLVGVGDWRVACKGKMGKFIIEKWENLGEVSLEEQAS